MIIHIMVILEPIWQHHIYSFKSNHPLYQAPLSLYQPIFLISVSGWEQLYGPVAPVAPVPSEGNLFGKPVAKLVALSPDDQEC